MTINSYQEATDKQKLVIDYCAKYAVVPRKADDPDLPEPWEGVSTEEIQKGVKNEFGKDISKGMGTWVWEKLGAWDDGTGYDVNEALEVLQDRREVLLDSQAVDNGTSSGNESKGSETASSSRVDSEEWVTDIRPPKRVNAQVSRIIRNTTLVRDLKERYNYCCQVCGESRQRSPSESYAEGHHLHPLGDSPPGPDTEENILVLCPNHHVDFDYGMVRVNPDTLEVEHAFDKEADGSTLTVRDEHSLDSQFLNYHNDEIAVF